MAFALDLWLGPESYEVHVCDAVESPWQGAEWLGELLDRGPALEHVLIREVIHIIDHAVMDDIPLKAYLDAPA